MLCVKVTISRYIDDAFPGWVECRMFDAYQHEHLFVEKVPMVTTANLELAGLPQAGVIPCVVAGRKGHDDGRILVLIDTQTPWGIESTTGQTQFEVFSDQVCELPREVEEG